MTARRAGGRVRHIAAAGPRTTAPSVRRPVPTVGEQPRPARPRPSASSPASSTPTAGEQPRNSARRQQPAPPGPSPGRPALPPGELPHARQIAQRRFDGAPRPLRSVRPVLHRTRTAAPATAAAKRSSGEPASRSATLSSPPDSRAASASTSPRSAVMHTSAHTLRSAGLVAARRIRVRAHSQDGAETPAPGVSVCRAACSRASGTDSSGGAPRTASAQRSAPRA